MKMQLAMAAIGRLVFMFALAVAVGAGGMGGAAAGAELFVSLDGAHDEAGGFSSWVGAATNIQDAVDAAVSGDVVRVGPGVYAVGARRASGRDSFSRVVIEGKSITLRGEGAAPDDTEIVGTFHSPSAPNGADAVRCLFVSSASRVENMRFSGGATRTSGNAGKVSDARGGGIASESSDFVASNCVFAGNAAMVGAGANGGAYVDCLFTNNAATYHGGGRMGRRFQTAWSKRTGRRAAAAERRIASRIPASMAAILSGAAARRAGLCTIAWSQTTPVRPAAA